MILPRSGVELAYRIFLVEEDGFSAFRCGLIVDQTAILTML